MAKNYAVFIDADAQPNWVLWIEQGQVHGHITFNGRTVAYRGDELPEIIDWFCEAGNPHASNLREAYDNLALTLDVEAGHVD